MDTIERLNELLEAERAGVETLSRLIEGATTPETRRLFEEVRDDEAWSCAGLASAIKRRGGHMSEKKGDFAARVMAEGSLGSRLRLLNRGQGWVVRRLDEILAREIDEESRAFLRDMRAVHARNIERCDGVIEGLDTPEAPDTRGLTPREPYPGASDRTCEPGGEASTAHGRPERSGSVAVRGWLADLQRALDREPVRVSDVRMGVFYTVARLETGEAGVAFTPRDLREVVCCPPSAAAAPRVGRLAGQPAWELAEEAVAPAPFRRAVGVAVLNALSARAESRTGFPVGRARAGVDALEAVGVQPQDRVVLVGGFVPFIKALKGRVADLRVVDKHPEALKPDEQPFWTAPAEAAGVLRQASVAIITGSVLVEGGLDDLLAASRGARRVALAGPTAPIWPEPFFELGVHVLGGIRIRDGEAMLQLIGEGGSGYFFEGVAEKVCLVRTEMPDAGAPRQGEPRKEVEDGTHSRG